MFDKISEINSENKINEMWMHGKRMIFLLSILCAVGL